MVLLFPHPFIRKILCLPFTGMLSSTCGIFQAESCASDRRGKLSVIVVLHNVVFYCIATWLTLGCSFLPGGWQWRLPLAVQVINNLFPFRSCTNTNAFSLCPVSSCSLFWHLYLRAHVGFSSKTEPRTGSRPFVATLAKGCQLTTLLYKANINPSKARS